MFQAAVLPPIQCCESLTPLSPRLGSFFEEIYCQMTWYLLWDICTLCQGVAVIGVMEWPITRWHFQGEERGGGIYIHRRCQEMGRGK